MKKILIAFLLSLSCACAFAAVGCGKNTDSTSSSTSNSGGSNPSRTFNVNFEEGEGFTFVSDTPDGGAINKGDTLTFSVDVGAFYTGSPVVYVNGDPIAPNDDGVYSVEMVRNVTVRAEGIKRDVSNMQGTGTMEDAFLVTKPIDLLYIAQQVNNGVSSYVNGAYVLMNDIDCKGEELEVIGDYRTESAYFAGCFSCYTDQDTNTMERYKISNFTISTNDINYVGLFGAVMVDMSVTSSGLFYGIQLENFTINASIDNPTDPSNLTIACGGLIGYGIGANTLLCDAINGEINMYSDDAYFSFAGGLIGYQQGLYAEEYDAYFPSEAAYCSADVDVNTLKGATLYAGGISGYLMTNYPFAPAYIDNCYATGDVSGAIRAGGIAGGLGQFTSVSNCYATGEIVAKSSQTSAMANDEQLEYCYASAGGIVGFAENDTIVNDSFFAGKTYAYAVEGKSYEKKGVAIAYGHEAGTALASSAKYVLLNNHSTNDASDMVGLANKLGWKDYNWIIENGSYPTINYEPTQTATTTTLTRVYLAKDENGKFSPVEVNNQTEVTLDYLNSAEDEYVTIGESFASGSLPLYVQADNGYLSYGYYLDKACTQKMPYSYLATGDITLYVAFADPTPIVGEYTLTPDHSDKPITLTLDEKGKATYTDGSDTRVTNYLYDGESLIIEAARLARYYTEPIVLDSTDTESDPYFDINRYAFYDYMVKVDGDTLEMYDNVYFTKDKPLKASKNVLRGSFYSTAKEYTFYGFNGTVTEKNADPQHFSYTTSGDSITLKFANGSTQTIKKSTLKAYDTFKGSWQKSATVNKNFVFDGKGNWSYSYSGYNRSLYGSAQEIFLDKQSGTYTVSADGSKMTLKGGTFNGYTVTLNSDGFMEIVGDGATQVYYRNGSYTGVWVSQGLKLTLNGLNADGLGTGVADFTESNLSFPITYEWSETENYIVAFTADTIIFGYFTYVLDYNMLNAVIYDPMTATYIGGYLSVVDDYNGEWISNNKTFETVEFDGNGFTLANYSNGGSIRINGNNVNVMYALKNSTLTGEFAYNGTLYTLTYDEDLKVVYISDGDKTTEFERKDIFANIDFVDLKGNTFTFDGKSSLLNGGKLTVNKDEYIYRNVDGEYLVYTDEAQVGNIVKEEKFYTLTIGKNSYELYIKNDLMGDWAISGAFQLFSIGPTDLTGNVSATFKGFDVELTYIDPAMLMFKYTDENMPIIYYVYKIDEENLVVSQYTNLYAGEYQVCTKANDLFGTWIYNRDDNRTITFDGVTSIYANGVAKMSQGKDSTMYYYTVKEDGIIMWSQEPLAGKTLYYKIEFTTNLSNRNAYVQGDKAILRTEVDALYLTEAKDEHGVTYVFNGMNLDDQEGTLSADNGKEYTYRVTSYNSNNTANLILTDKDTGIVYDAVLDYRDMNNILLSMTPSKDNV